MSGIEYLKWSLFLSVKGYESMNTKNHSQDNGDPSNLNLKRLTLDQVRQIDEAILSIGEYGEVHLIIQRGRIKYLNRVESIKTWKKEDET